MSPPPQDAAIIDALLAEAGVSRPLVRNISALSCESCPPYREELVECWRIVGYELQSTPRAVTCGALRYLQDKYAEDIKEAVYRSADAQLGGVPDAWAIVCGYGRVKFETDDFPSCAAHVWFAAYVATRAGIAHLLVELPDRGAPCSDRCPALRTVCALMARRLQAVAAAAPNSAGQQSQDFAMGGDADPADLLRADLAETGGSPFHDILLALLLGRRFGLGGLPEGTVEDWIWFRLHALQIGAGDINQAPEFAQQLEALRQHTLTLRPSHYDPMGSGAAPPSGFGAPGEQPLPAMGVHSYGAAQTLNSVKVLLLTGQFGRAVQELRAQDRCLWGPALHIALVLHRAGALGALAGSGPPTNVAGLVCDYACRFGCGDQLRYLRALDPADRVQALQRLLLRGDIGTSDELLGFIDANGQHHPGLLELTLHEDGLGGQPEFVKLCADTGSAAYEHGQYREAPRDRRKPNASPQTSIVSSESMNGTWTVTRFPRSLGPSPGNSTRRGYSTCSATGAGQRQRLTSSSVSSFCPLAPKTVRRTLRPTARYSPSTRVLLAIMCGPSGTWRRKALYRRWCFGRGPSNCRPSWPCTCRAASCSTSRQRPRSQGWPCVDLQTSWARSEKGKK